MGASAGADGATLWSWGAFGDTVAATLNPWSSQTWQLTANQGQLSGGDGYLLGSRDDGSTTGPWFTEGDYGVLMKLLVDAAGDLIVTVSASGFVTFNGGQTLLPTGGYTLAKIDHTNGRILWRTPISAEPDAIALAPGNRIVTLGHLSGDSAPYTISIYSDADGVALSNFSTGIGGSDVVASGSTELYVVGAAPVATDFDPGVGSDVLGSTPGVFVSRFSFQ